MGLDPLPRPHASTWAWPPSPSPCGRHKWMAPSQSSPLLIRDVITALWQTGLRLLKTGFKLIFGFTSLHRNLTSRMGYLHRRFYRNLTCRIGILTCWMGHHSHETLEAEVMVGDAEDSLFSSYSAHVLRPFSTYNRPTTWARPQPHDFSLPDKDDKKLHFSHSL